MDFSYYTDDDDNEEDNDDNIHVTIGPTTIVRAPFAIRNRSHNTINENIGSTTYTTTATTTTNTFTPHASPIVLAGEAPVTTTSTTLPDDENARLFGIINAESHYNVTDILRFDTAIRDEFYNLILKSVYPDTTNCIAVSYAERVILISVNTVLSSQLANLLFRTALAYKPTFIALASNMEIIKQLTYNLSLNGLGNKFETGEKIALFSAKYTRYSSTTGNGTTKQNTNNSSNNNEDKGFKRSFTGLYNYTDFTVLIIQNSQIIEYAIHAYSSNINEMLRTHNPKKIFYNSLPGEALDVFLRYPYQPFYQGIGDLKKLTPVRINKINNGCNTLIYCQRQDTFCSFCIALREYRGLLFQLPTFETTPWNSTNNNLERYIPNKHRRLLPKGKNHLNQPTHNSRRLRLIYASKTPNSFNGFDKNRNKERRNRITGKLDRSRRLESIKRSSDGRRHKR